MDGLHEMMDYMDAFTLSTSAERGDASKTLSQRAVFPKCQLRVLENQMENGVETAMHGDYTGFRCFVSPKWRIKRKSTWNIDWVYIGVWSTIPVSVMAIGGVIFVEVVFTRL